MLHTLPLSLRRRGTLIRMLLTLGVTRAFFPHTVLAAQSVGAVVSDSTQSWLDQLQVFICGDSPQFSDCPYKDFVRAEALMTHVDSFGQTARRARILMHNALAQGYANQRKDIIGNLSSAHHARVGAHLRAALRVFAETPTYVDWNEYKLEFNLYWLLLNWVTEYLRPDSVPIVVAQAQVALERYDTTPEAKHDRLYVPYRTRTKAQLTDDRMEDGLMGHWYNYRLQGGNVPAPRLEADAWFPPPGRPTSDTIRPVPGKVNLICMGGQPTNDTIPDNSPWGMLRQPYLTVLIRHSLQKYGAQNLEVTLVYPATIDTNDNNDISLASAIAHWTGPGTGAERWRRYIQEHEHLPVTVAVQGLHSQWRQAEDGHRVSVTALQFNEFWLHDPAVTHTWTDDLKGSELRNPLVKDFPLAQNPVGLPGQCVIVGKDGTMEHSSLEPDYLVNTQAALRLLFEGPGAPPRPGQKSWVDPY